MPPRSRNIIIGTTTIAFCASLAVHAFVAVTAIDQYVDAKIYLPGFDRSRLAESTSDRILIPLNEPAPAQAPQPDEELGRSDGTGTAIDDSPGELPLIARKGPQDQAFLSRDPAGPGRMHSELSDSTLPPGAAAMPAPPTPVSESPSDLQTRQEPVEESIESHRTIPFGVGELETKQGDSDADRPSIAPRPAVEGTTDAEQAVAESPQTTAIQVVGEPGAPIAPADPAPQADTESDPFTVVGGANFRSGGTKAQLGRAHRLTYPRIGLSGLVDGVQIGRARLVLQLTIDQSGNVKSATIFKSSGSGSIDQACRTTAYEWWFEPQKGSNGQPRREETFLFLITFS
jgi:TonB family protein